MEQQKEQYACFGWRTQRRDEAHCSTPIPRRVLANGAIGRVVHGEADWGKGRRRLTDWGQDVPVELTQHGMRG